VTPFNAYVQGEPLNSELQNLALLNYNHTV